MGKIIGITFLFLVWLQSSIGNACDCVGKPTIQEAFQNSDYVFVGKVLAISNDASTYPGHKRLYFGPKTVFKGAMSLKKVITPSQTCGAPLRVGNSYLISAFSYKGYAKTHLCSVNILKSQADRQLLWLYKKDPNPKRTHAERSPKARQEVYRSTGYRWMKDWMLVDLFGFWYSKESSGMELTLLYNPFIGMSDLKGLNLLAGVATGISKDKATYTELELAFPFLAFGHKSTTGLIATAGYGIRRDSDQTLGKQLTASLTGVAILPSPALYYRRITDLGEPVQEEYGVMIKLPVVSALFFD